MSGLSFVAASFDSTIKKKAPWENGKNGYDENSLGFFMADLGERIDRLVFPAFPETDKRLENMHQSLHLRNESLRQELHVNQEKRTAYKVAGLERRNRIACAFSSTPAPQDRVLWESNCIASEELRRGLASVHVLANIARGVNTTFEVATAVLCQSGPQLSIISPVLGIAVPIACQAIGDTVHHVAHAGKELLERCGVDTGPVQSTPYRERIFKEYNQVPPEETRQFFQDLDVLRDTAVSFAAAGGAAKTAGAAVSGLSKVSGQVAKGTAFTTFLTSRLPNASFVPVQKITHSLEKLVYCIEEFSIHTKEISPHLEEFTHHTVEIAHHAPTNEKHDH